MSLTKGSSPFGEPPAGAFNFEPQPPEHVLYVERTTRRVRVLLRDEVVADSQDVRLLHPPGRTPTYLFPRDHVRTELCAPSPRSQADPGMRDRTYWSVQVDRRRAPDAAYSWESPPQEAAAIAGLIAFDWDSLTVFEEDEEVFVHPRDPYTRIDVLRSSRRVRVTVAGAVVADSTNPRMLLESGLPVRWYLPREDVRTDLLEPSGTTTLCPYKGIAQYWSLRLPERYEEDLVWSYPEPDHDAEAERAGTQPHGAVGMEDVRDLTRCSFAHRKRSPGIVANEPTRSPQPSQGRSSVRQHGDRRPPGRDQTSTATPGLVRERGEASTKELFRPCGVWRSLSGPVAPRMRSSP